MIVGDALSTDQSRSEAWHARREGALQGSCGEGGTVAKPIFNPLGPNVDYAVYERRVGDILDKLANDPSFAKELFRYSIQDLDLWLALGNVRLVRRTPARPTWAGASGYAHRIDESFSTEDARVIVLVECKHWAKTIGIPEFSTFLVRLIDIAKKEDSSHVLGILVTTQGAQGGGGGHPEVRSGVTKLRDYFDIQGYPIAIQVLADYV